MAGTLNKTDEEAVQRARQLLAFNQVSVVMAMAAGFVFYFGWITSPWLLVGEAWMFVFLCTIHVARRRLTVDNLIRVGLLLVLCNWGTALVLTALAPFSYSLGVLQVIIPTIAAGPVAQRRLLLWLVPGATVLTGIVVATGLLLEDSELNDAVNEDVQDVVLIIGVPILTVAVGIVAWDAHTRQQLALRRALDSNELLRESRARLVTAADEERRRIERDLHDGAQQQLVAVAMQLRLLRSTHDLAAEVDPLVDELEASLENLRELAHGIYPPLLRSRGLNEALRAGAARAPLPVDVQVVNERFDPGVEAAVYFCCLEALQNAAKHAGPGASVRMHLDVDQDRLVGIVQDDGPGFTSPIEDWGVGLRNMEDRIVAVGGELAITDNDGTLVSFSVPLAAEPLPMT